MKTYNDHPEMNAFTNITTHVYFDQFSNHTYKFQCDLTKWKANGVKRRQKTRTKIKLKVSEVETMYLVFIFNFILSCIYLTVFMAWHAF